jgi:hypothetical protein
VTGPRPVREETIRIALPLSMDVAGSLLKAIGVMWPGACMGTSDPHTMTVVIPDAERRPKGSRKALVAAKDTSDGPEVDSQITRFDGQTLTATVPEALQEMAGYAAIILRNTDGAINYVEQEMTDTATGKQLVFSVAYSKGQTPHALRIKAEARVAELEALLAEREGQA